MKKTIRELRKEKKLTQKELAALTGLSQSSISSIENRRAKDILHNNLVKIAKALGVSVEEIDLR